MFRLLLSLGAMFAVVMLVVAGIGYMLSESALDIDKAKGRAKAALWGLLLLSMSWLILYTINPNLLKFNLLNQDVANQQTTTPNGQAQSAALLSTYTSNTLTVGAGEGDPGTQISQFTSKCEAAGGRVPSPTTNGTNVTYTCNTPNYMP